MTLPQHHARATMAQSLFTSNWRARGRASVSRCPDIEAATKGVVRCEDLRPDVNWAVVRGNTEQAAQEAA